MRIGYACLTHHEEHTDYKTCRKDNATPTRLESLIEYNLQSLENVIDYNFRNHISLFRISSDVIPFGSSPVNTIDWQSQFKDKLDQIGQKIAQYKMRVSMHPGQYTVINALRTEVVERAIADLVYHTAFLDALSLDETHKIVLHIGGSYDDKTAAKKRFIDQYNQLDERIRRRLIIENDDKIYTICDVLEIGYRAKIPVVYDNLHNQALPCDINITDAMWIERAQRTWKQNDGTQKIHYSEQDESKQRGSHSQTITAQSFHDFYKSLQQFNCDIMLEVKDKNLSTIKANNIISPSIQSLEKEWSRYKYTILEKDPVTYEAIRKLLKDKIHPPVIQFYELIEHALKQPNQLSYQKVALEHVWGYFKTIASKDETLKYKQWIEEKNANAYRLLKRMLYQLAQKHHIDYLLDSHYFYL